MDLSQFPVKLHCPPVRFDGQKEVRVELEQQEGKGMTQGKAGGQEVRQRSKTSNRYDAEFKSNALALVQQEGMDAQRVARQLGVCIDTLKSWMKAASTTPEDVSSRETRETMKALQAEIKALKKEVQEQAVIIDVLKKATAIFSQPYNSDMK